MMGFTVLNIFFCTAGLLTKLSIQGTLGVIGANIG